MACLPYGYIYKDGRICIDEMRAEQVRNLFDSFIAGLTYEMAARSAGIEVSATNVKGMLRNSRYRGEAGFEQIIDPAVFDAAEKERFRRATRRLSHRGKRIKQPIPVGVFFKMRKSNGSPSDPFEKASYIYSLIETEEQNDSDS